MDTLCQCSVLTFLILYVFEIFPSGCLLLLLFFFCLFLFLFQDKVSLAQVGPQTLSSSTLASSAHARI